MFMVMNSSAVGMTWQKADMERAVTQKAFWAGASATSPMLPRNSPFRQGGRATDPGLKASG